MRSLLLDHCSSLPCRRPLSHNVLVGCPGVAYNRPAKHRTCAAASQTASNMWGAVLHTYNSAQDKGAASSFQTQVHIRPDQGIQFILRMVASLKAKPTAPQQQQGGNGSKQKEWRNPFLPYEEDLWVTHLSDTHTLLLNKFNVVPHHLLVVTREFQSQQDPLKAADLDATLQVLRAMPQGGLAFYNCGPQSGRSQPHKHVQVVPLPLLEGQPAVMPTQALLQTAAAAQQLPLAPLQAFAAHTFPMQAYAAQLPGDVSGLQLQCCLEELQQMAQAGTAASAAGGEAAEAAASETSKPGSTSSGQPDGAPSAGAAGGSSAALSADEVFSYNVLLTQEWVLLVPRSQEMAGPCAINALGFAGTILMKSEEQLQYVEAAGGPLAVLKAVGVPWPQHPAL